MTLEEGGRGGVQGQGEAPHIHQQEVPQPQPHSQDVQMAARNGRKQVSSGSWVCCMPCYVLRTNTSLHKASLTVVTLLVTSLLVASPVLFLISSVPANEQPHKDCNIYEDEDCLVESTLPDVPLSKCDSAICKDIARRMRYSLSWDHDPCKNFYNFACGGWPESQKADSSRPYTIGLDLSIPTSSKKIFLLIQNLIKLNGNNGRFKKVGDFYRSCMSSLEKPVDMTPIYRVLDQLGGYLPSGSLGPNDLTPLVISLLKVSGTPLFNLILGPDIGNKSMPALYIDLPDSIIERERRSFEPVFVPQNVFLKYGVHLTDRHNETRRRRRRKREKNTASNPYNYIKDKTLEAKLSDLEGIVSGMLPKRMDPVEKGIEIQQILLFASTVEQLYPGERQLRHELEELNSYSYYSEKELQTEFPIVNWQHLFKEMVPDREKLDMKVYIISEIYMRSLADVMKKFQNRNIHNALLAMYARDYLYYVMNNKVKSLKPDDVYCTSMTTKLYPYPVSALYLSHFADDYLRDLQTRADDMFLNLKLSLFNRVEKATWIDNESRWKVMDRITNMTAKFIGWASLLNDTVVDQIVDNMDVSDDFFDNIMKHYRQKRQEQMRTDSLIPYDLMLPYPFVVNAFYSPDDNYVVLPLALLSQPYFALGVPAYISYGSIGVILAHEMLHSLNYFSLDGKSVSSLWKDSKSLSALQTRIACVVNSYHESQKKGLKFLGKDIQLEFDGNYTLDETMADLTGAQVAWGAWRQSENADKEKTLSNLPLAPSKLFFLSYSQFYCINITAEDYIVAVEENYHKMPPERVNGLVRNLFTFSDSYQCNVGSPMNPATKCNIW